MKIESSYPSSVLKQKEVSKLKPAEEKKDAASVVASKPAPRQGMDISLQGSREMVENFSEWYFKQGKLYETTKSYRQAISAYERANSVDPSLPKAQSVDGARRKAYQG